MFHPDQEECEDKEDGFKHFSVSSIVFSRGKKKKSMEVH